MIDTDETSDMSQKLQTPSPGHALYQMAMGHFVPRALALVTQLGIADLLKDGPCGAHDLAVATQTHTSSLARILRLLASVGVFAELSDGKFALTPLGEPLCTNAPGSVRALVLMFCGVGVQGAWGDLEACVRTGEPAFRRIAPGAESPYPLMAGNPELTALFDEAMATVASWSASAVAAAIDFSQFGRIVDIGGGNGALLIGLLEAYPRSRGVVFDQPHAVARAQQRITSAGLEERCDVIAGNFFEGVPSGGDAYLLRHVLVDWDDERATTILRNCRTAMPQHGQIMILEGTYPARIALSASCQKAAGHDVNMLVCTGGRLRTEEEFRGLLAASGFRLLRVVPTTADVSVIQGEPV
jgi:hypothetical protein